MSKESYMKVALLLEGSPGHEKQSLAIAQELQRLVSIEVCDFRIPELTKWQRVVELGQLYAGIGSCRYDLTGFDLAIGTGSKTHAQLVACKKKYGIAIVTCMAPDKLLRGKFDLCCVPRHDELEEKDNIFLTDGPPVLSVKEGNKKESGKGLILLGGIDESSHFWRGVEIAGFVRHIVLDSPDIEWSISSSPRTPDETNEIIKAYSESLQNATFFNYRDTPRGWVEEQYARARVAWVTADSVSMVYEALTAGCKVGIIPVRWKKARNKFQRSIDYLLLKDLVKVYSPAVSTSLLSMPDQPFNEAQRCAKQIIRKLKLQTQPIR